MNTAEKLPYASSAARTDLKRKEARVMERFVPREKMSKKARRALDRERRVSWSFSPVTRKVESKKRFGRKRRGIPEEDAL